MEPLPPIFYSRKLFLGTGLVLFFALRNQLLLNNSLTPTAILMYVGLGLCIVIITLLTAMKKG